MDSLIDIAAARSLVADPALWPRVRDFLWDFASQVHDSWLEDLGPWRRLSDSPRVRRFILSSLGVEPCFHGFPKDDWSRLLLLDGATLLQMAKWLGALACADSLRRITDGAEVRALKAELPGIYPEVFQFTAYFREFAEWSGRDACGMGGSPLEVGVSLLRGALAHLPESLVSRLAFKLPRTLCVSAPLRETEDCLRGMALPAIRRLLKLKFPEAYSLCC